MHHGVRNSIWALFFLAGMMFMAMLIFMVRPNLFSRPTFQERPGTSVILGGGTGGAAEDDGQSTPTEIQTNPQQRETPPIQAARLPTQILTVQTPSSEVDTNIAAQSDPSFKPMQPAGDEQQITKPETIPGRRPGRSIFGHVSLLGELPPPKTITLNDGYCGGATFRTNLVSRVYIRSGDNSVADALVFISDGLKSRRWNSPPPARVSMRNCQFDPYITAIQTGQPVIFENFDRILHGITARSQQRDNGFKPVALMPKSRPVSIRFRETELFLRVECNVHPYMVGYICVLDHPFFAITKENGRFQIPDLPTGKYLLTAIHRKAGSQTLPVVVADNTAAEANFELHVPMDVAQAP